MKIFISKMPLLVDVDVFICFPRFDQNTLNIFSVSINATLRKRTRYHPETNE